ncbi:MAG: dihydrofolate reductase family protein [Prolixibacteraceae bacterium]|jgi:dihydrofolate reductase|nr:dihydrofolate reductase family protein [Prolixibacteraceae bacterium]
MERKNKVFIAASLDGYIADKNGGLEWLNSISNPDNIDMGYAHFMNDIDAIVMGRVTFETVCDFDVDWPYNKPVFVLSRTLKKVKEEYKSKAELMSGSPEEILDVVNQRGFYNLYVDGGRTIQNFLKKDLIDELIITTIPILLGGGSRLFSDLPEELEFELVDSEVFLNQIVQNHYKRKR